MLQVFERQFLPVSSRLGLLRSPVLAQRCGFGTWSMPLEVKDCVNALCPFSGKAVQADSLTTFEGHVVGFCNPGCRDNFASSPENYPDAVSYFRDRSSGHSKDAATKA